MTLKNRRVAILVESLYEDLELWYPALRFREAGAEVVLIGPRLDTFNSKHGYPAKADLAIEQANISDFDAVVIPGGYAPDHLRRNAKMIAFVRIAAQKGLVVAAICHAGWVLASADIVRGKRLTSFMSIKDDMVNAGGHFEDKEVVQDGNLITSRTPHDLPAFCRTIITALSAAPASGH